MKNLIKKLFNSRQKNELTYISFEKLKVESEVAKIFRAISKYSKNSEIRYVGGCVRKVLNKEKTDDIDLAVNLEPKTVCNILKKELSFVVSFLFVLKIFLKKLYISGWGARIRT